MQMENVVCKMSAILFWLNVLMLNFPFCSEQVMNTLTFKCWSNVGKLSVCQLIHTTMS